MDVLGKARMFMDGWLANPGHREAMLDPDSVRVGIGVAVVPTLGGFFERMVFVTQKLNPC